MKYIASCKPYCPEGKEFDTFKAARNQLDYWERLSRFQEGGILELE